jgi:double stranded RNA-specific editase B
VVGVQGALLTHFIEPIYLYSVTLGSLFHAHHMFRAVAGRIQQTVEGLPQPYRLNVPRYFFSCRRISGSHCHDFTSRLIAD